MLVRLQELRRPVPARSDLQLRPPSAVPLSQPCTLSDALAEQDLAAGIRIVLRIAGCGPTVSSSCSHRREVATTFAQSVAPGRPLTRRDVSERPVIHKGDVVDVIAHQGVFSIRMKAQALENGIKRELIKMRNIESRKDFTAQVVNESEVEVHF